MKFSKKLKKQLKKKTITAVASTMAVLTLVATSNQVSLLEPLNDFMKNGASTIVMQTAASLVNRGEIATIAENSDASNITYIYTAQDFANFRDSVNNGESYEGKTVYLMADIDLSSICSSELGSWIRIGTGETVFNGTFDGREKTISGIYINNTTGYNGIFRALGAKGTIKNLTVKGNMTSGLNTGGIVGYNSGLVEKCTNYVTMNHKGNDWIIGGIVGYNKGTVSKCINYANITGYDSVGGIAGVNNGTIKECVNKGNIKNTYYSAGGIVGINGYNKSGVDAAWCGTGKIYSCYNTGTVTGKTWAGGVVGALGYNRSSAQSYIYDSYSIGTASITGHIDYGSAVNCYTKLVNYRVLSPYFLNDIHNQNNGYPILKWQTTQYNIVENQAYIKIGETLSLTLEMEGEYEDLNNVTWTSGDETVATVDNTGKVTGKSVGRTTITFCNNNSGLKAKAVVNIYRNKAGAITVPQLEIGDGYTLILREDGTVWSVGRNNVGQLGDGTTTNKNLPVQVKIDENTYLTNVKKISADYSHSAALTTSGEVYVWGYNETGKLGQGDTENRLYATKLKGVAGEGYINNITDVVCNDYTTYVLNKDRVIYGAGYNKWIQIDDTGVDTKYLKKVADMEGAAGITAGYSNFGIVNNYGEVIARGHTPKGSFGNEKTADKSRACIIAAEINQASLSGYMGTVLKESGIIWTTGDNTYGQLGSGNTTGRTSFAKLQLNGTDLLARYISGGSNNIGIHGKDGKVYFTGYNGKGQISNGSTTNATTATVMLNADGTAVSDALFVESGIGLYTRNALNNGIIRQDGSIWLSGDNTYGQLGNGSNTGSTYLTKMTDIPPQLTYTEKNISILPDGRYQIDKNKLQYIYKELNVYPLKELQINNLKYTSLNEDIATVNQNGVVKAKNIEEGIATIKVEDTDNGYETYITVVINRKQNTEEITYIYTAQDLADFRDDVNNGNNYEGKTVYVMADIDLSTVCSQELAESWVPIGVTSTNFKGTFNGNYHTISNLYINSNKYVGASLFNQLAAGGTIQNVIMENVNISNTYNATNAFVRSSGIATLNYGTILNCGIKSGNITSKKTSVNTTADTWPGSFSAGITANNYGKVSGCYNKASISAYSTTSQNYNESYAGGIACWNYSELENCYNTGSITATSYGTFVGGVVASEYNTYNAKGYIKNCYNVGAVSGSGNGYLYVAGVLGRNGNSWCPTLLPVTNCYCLNNTAYSIKEVKSSGSVNNKTAGRVAAATMKTYTAQLGSAFAYDVYNKNTLYPVLAWENETPVMTFEQNQAYIKTNQKLQLNIVKDVTIGGKINFNYNASNFKWVSTNEEVATVDSNGLVTGHSDGTATIYAYQQEADMYAMAIINVASNIANPQIATGNGFTEILKADGTVWTVGNNEKGQCGNGTNETSKSAQKVQIDEDTQLSNIVKIAVGTDHSLALTKDGKIYSWGDNTYGQLGHNNTDASNYAKLVLAEDGQDYLKNIVDISVGAYNSVALTKDGSVYVWGKGATGAIGNEQLEDQALPVKTKIQKAIKVSSGFDNITALTSEGTVWACGYNANGELGINCNKNTSWLMKTALNVTDVSCGAYHTFIQKADKNFYSVGASTYGRRGTTATAGVTTYEKASLPSAVSETNPVKQVEAGRLNTTMLLQDGSVWQTGYGEKGELGNGTNSNSTSFVQGLTAENTPLANVLTIGKNNGVAGVVQTSNTAVILKNGDVYATGDNTYSQLGDGTTTATNYYQKMGFCYLDYEDKTVTVGNEGYQIDLNKLKYIYSSINVYNNEQDYSLGELKYSIENEVIASVNENGKITINDGTTGVTKVTIEDITNGYSTDFTIVVNRLEDTDTVIYIYNLDDLIKFRNSVNAGNDYSGKTVYIMGDIDMSPECSETNGSWEPIGTGAVYFKGTLDGNYHTLKNLYINSDKYRLQGLFTNIPKEAIIKNLLFENVSITNNYNVTTSNPNTGTIAGLNYGTILNCGIKSGNLVGRKTSASNVRNNWPGPRTGGIIGSNYGKIADCYNKAAISSYAPTSPEWNEMFAGGIVAGNYGGIENCYNTGNVTGTAYGAYTGGICGHGSGETGAYIKNCYSTGTITGSGKWVKIGGAIGRSGWNSTYIPMKLSNNYCLNNVTYSYCYVKGSTYYNVAAGKTEAETLKTYSTRLGADFQNDESNINNGYPILWWEAIHIELNKKQEYIQIGDTLNLSIIQNSQAQEVFGRKVEISDFNWSSSNPAIAEVNENGVITGLAEGYTTIYGYNEAHKIYTMCKVNVAKEKATPQVETGEDFTVILKADGTVWALGKNDQGQLGDGTNEDKIEAVQVKIDETNYLTDIIKIAVGSNHTLALTKNGEVYSWGANNYGQLGNNQEASANYAQKVVGEGGASYLDRIIDISAGTYGSTAINQFGWNYVWGNGSHGELANGIAASSKTPVKTPVVMAIGTTMGTGHVVVQTQNGGGYTWGRNTYGELAIGNTTNKGTISKVGNKVIDISASGYETIVRNAMDEIWGAGLNTGGQLGTGNKTNAIQFTKVAIPTQAEIQYIKAGRNSTSVMLADGTVWTAGLNAKGELGNKTNTQSSTFVQAKTEKSNLENMLMLGRSSGEAESLNVAAIGKNGRVYLTGANEYGQMGDNTKQNRNYFKEMGYTLVNAPEKIIMHKGETKTYNINDLKYTEKYFNVYREDIIEESLIGSSKILDNNIATYEGGKLVAQNVGKTMLIVNEESTKTHIYIPVWVLPEEGDIVPDVQTGNNFTIALKSNGTVWSFGENSKGELGLGNNVNQNVPMQVPGFEVPKQTTDTATENTSEENIPNQSENTGDGNLPNQEATEELAYQKVEQISVGNGHVIALTEAGEVYTWGQNNKGQLGTGNTKNSNTVQKIQIPIPEELVPVIAEKIVKVIASNNTSYAITTTGKLFAWGEGYQTKPTQVEGANNIIDISKSYKLDEDGNVYSLATNERLKIVEKIKYISEGATHTVFLSEAGTAYSVGSNTFGQFGDGSNVSSQNEVVAIRNQDLTDVLRGITKIEAGDGYTVAVLEDKTIVSCGRNQNSQLGIKDVDESNVVLENTQVKELAISAFETISLMDAGADHVAFSLTNGNVYTYGLGEQGQHGNNKNETKVEPQLVGKNIVEVNKNNLQLNPNETFDLTAHTTYFNLIYDIQGKIAYESKDESVVTVDENSGKVKAITPGVTSIVAREVGTEELAVIQVRVLPEGITIEPQVKTNGSHTVTLKVDGTVWSYGNNTNGELGNGTTTYSDEPVQAILPDGTKIIQVEAGENFSLALDSNGDVWAWGANNYSQLGNTSTGNQTKPTKIAGLKNITKIAAGTYSCLAIDSNKQVYGWGLNANGELGIGSYTNKVSKPTKAKDIADVIDIAVGKNHSIILNGSGKVFVTGLNLYGQLGNNDTSIKKVNTYTKVEKIKGAARIGATDSGNIVSNINGKVYTWGLNIYGELGLGDKNNHYEPTLIENLENIVLVSGGKNHSILLNKTGNVYTAGSNKYGMLGTGDTGEKLTFAQVPKLSQVMNLSAGNTYTVVAKEDGTVWGFGDYNHGDKNLKSKTNSKVPMQVGNDTFGLGVTKVTIKKSETISITSNMAYNFNLIYLNQNNKENITYQSMNESIAKVNEKGEVLGVREGATLVKAIEADGKEHVVYVYVTDNQLNYAPSIKAGENFAGVLKGDGSIWTFGHNNNGELGIGSNKTKDIPEKTNVIASYKEIVAGNNFTIAIRTDGAVWGYGKNNYGQLGIGTLKNELNPVQISGLTDIVQIAAGKEHAVALDDFGILYGWGRNNHGQLGLSGETILTPTPISYTGGTIESIWAGENQTIIINTKGKVYGYGDLLNGELSGIENAVKVAIGNNIIYILTTDQKVYAYNGKDLTEVTGLNNVMDIDIKRNNVIAQTINEKVYTFKVGETPKLEAIENVYTIGAGVNNNYVILTDGTAYAKGKNEYGQLGNSTRIDSLSEFTLIGDRTFTVEPENKIMYVNDIEKLTEQIQGNEFNVFNRKLRKAEEYTYTSSNNAVVQVNSGILTAKSEGTAKITIQDKVTGEKVNITRVVIPVEKDRIETITVNKYEAKIVDEYKYEVEVQTNGNSGTLTITTKDKTDKISIDNGSNWADKGTLTQEIDLTKDETILPILVQTSNGTQIAYELKVKKIATDVSLEKITVDGKEATAISSTNYEIVLPEDVTVSDIEAIAKSQKAKVSINGEAYKTWKATSRQAYEDATQLVIPIIVQAENKDELEYTLTIYKTSAVLELESLTVEGEEAIKTSEGVYSITIPRTTTEAEVTAKAVSELVKVSLDGSDGQVQIATKKVVIDKELTEVTIRLTTTVEGKEIYKDYVLNIYKKAESGKVQFVIVNGKVITPKADGTYEVFLPKETTEATLKVIAENASDYVQIESNPKAQKQSEAKVSTPEDSNSYTFTISDEQNTSSQSYTVYIKKPSVDATLSQITVSSGEDKVTAKKSTEEKNVYIAKVKASDSYLVTAVTNHIGAYVTIADGKKEKHTTSKAITKENDYIEVPITVESENGDKQEYTLKIYTMSQDTSLESVTVNGKSATLQSDGSYLINLDSAQTEVTVKAVTTHTQAKVKIDDANYDTHITSQKVIIDSKETKAVIEVEAEDGTTKQYTLVITGLPDDATLKQVKVNGKEAIYIEGQNKYEIRTDATSFNIEAIANDSLAKVALNSGEQKQGSNTFTLSKKGDTTYVTIKVVAQDGVDSSTYTLEIKEKSNDTSIAEITVNGAAATKTEDGNYKANVTTQEADIHIEAADLMAVVSLDGETKNTNAITVKKTISQRETVYTFKIVAEDGTEEEHTLTITKLSENTNLKELSVTVSKQIQNEETGETQTVESKQAATLMPDGTYYLKIDKVEKAKITAIAEDENAKVKIKNSAYQLTQNEKEVETVAQKTIVTITVQAEGGNTRDYDLILEKKSNDTTLKEITSKDILKQEEDVIYVDESLETIDLTFVTNDKFASIKLEKEENYTLETITRTISLKEEDIPEDYTGEGVPVVVTVQAEDGTIGTHVIKIKKTGNTDITEVKVNNETITEQNGKYTARVNVADKAALKITTSNKNATIEIIQRVENADGTITETVIGTAKGILTLDVPLTSNPQNYIMRITSAQGTDNKECDLVLEQKSTDVGLSYVKVDEITAVATDAGYRASVSGKDLYPVVIKPTDEKAKVKIAYKDYVGDFSQGKLQEDVPVLENETLEVTITVQSENGEEKTYLLWINRISANADIEYVKVNDSIVNDFDSETNTYSIVVDNSLFEVPVEVKAKSDKAKLTIGTSEMVGKITTKVTLDGPGTTKKVTIRVDAENGTTKYYYLDIIQLSDNISLNSITVNDKVATSEDGIHYEVTIPNSKAEALVKVVAKNAESSVSIAGESSTKEVATKSFEINGQAVIQTTITITAADGEKAQDYTLTIYIKDTNNDLEHVKVNSHVVTPEENTNVYPEFIEHDSTSANVEIKAQSSKATIIINNAEELGITEGTLGKGMVSFEVNTPETVTTIQYTVTSETGESKTGTIILTKVSTDNSLKELYVDGNLIQVNEKDGNYYTTLENPKEVVVKAVANNEYANIRIDYNPEEKQQTQANINAGENTTKVTITITSQSGVTKKYYLYIRTLVNNTELDKIVVDGTEVTKYNEATKTYIALVDRSKNDYEAFLMAVNSQATVELFEGEELLGSGVASVTEVLHLTETEEEKTYQVKVSLDEEHYTNYTLKVVRSSNDTKLKRVEVNDVPRTPLAENDHIYEIGIPKLAETAKIKVLANSNYATVRIGDHETELGSSTVDIALDLNEKRTTVPVVVTAPDGETIDTFNILLIRQSNEVNLESVVVNGNELENVDDVYTYYMPKDEFKANTAVTTVDDATIEVDAQSGIGYLEFDVDLKNDTIKTEKKIKVTSEDGSVTKEYTLVIWKKTQIKGIITTENFEGKHKSTISLYKVEDETATQTPSENVQGENNGQVAENSNVSGLGKLVEQIETKEDGSFTFEISEVGNYKVVVTKDGYLTYIVTDITITPGSIVELEKYHLLAGDIAKTGEIEIDDLVSLNDNIGVDITDENRKEKSIYDLNEDGVINNLDRNILKKNYSKKAQTVKWINPDTKATELSEKSATLSLRSSNAIVKEKSTTSTNGEVEAQDFINPLNCKYVITSNYGYREGPITKTNEKHTGIDISGTHHAEVLAVASGEVTFAGVQNGYGNCIEIKHIVNGETIYSFYAHLSKINVKAGQKVEQGSVIALEGGDPETDPNHGDSTGHHLHFEIRTKSGYGNDVDPTKYIRF